MQGQRPVLAQGGCGFRRRQHQRFGQHPPISQEVFHPVRQRRDQQADVDFIVLQRFELQVGGGFAQFDLYLRKGSAELVQEGRQHAVVGGRHEGQGEPAGLAGCRAARQVGQGLRVVQQLARPRQQRGAGRCQRHAAAGAGKKRRAEQRFERLYALRQRWLRHMQPLRGASEMHLFGHGDKVAQLP